MADIQNAVRRVAFLGLGTMGFPMAGHLAQAGYEVTVYNRTRKRAEAWLSSYPGTSADTPAAAARGADVVFSCVGNDDDVRAVVLGESGAFSGMAAGAVFVDHTTASAELAEELEACAQAGRFHFLDAPVSGGQVGAETGALTVMAGGEAAVFTRVEVVIDSYAKAVTLMGPVGSGQRTKMVNQICIAGLVQGLAEAMHFAQRAGLDGERVLDVISKGAAQSWQMDNRGKTMLADQFDFGFAVDWMSKDLAICLREAKKRGALLPVTALVDQFYSTLQARGGGRWDTSSLIRLLNQP